MAVVDNNGIAVMLAALQADGATALELKADPSTHSLATADGSTGSDTGNDDASRNENHLPILLAASSDDDGATVPLFVDSFGRLLIQSE